MNCKKCGAPTENVFELVTLKTMVDRGWRKNKYYQAMGDIFKEAVCDKCIDEYIGKISNPTKKIVNLSIRTAVVVIGCVLLFLLVQLTAFRVFCAIIGILAILAFIQELSHLLKSNKEVTNTNITENRKALAVKLISTLLPNKHNDAELTYVDTYLIKKGDLEKIGKEYGFSVKKLTQVRAYLKDNKTNQKQNENSDNDKILND